jgi:selenocysteine lyase/cysteine desulfurase
MPHPSCPPHPLLQVDSLPLEPLATFPARCTAAAAQASAAGRPYGLLYTSQVTYLTQQTLLPDVPGFVTCLHAALAAAASSSSSSTGSSTTAAGLTAAAGLPETVVVIDGYHGFGALPTDLASLAGSCCYVAGMLKHMGCGANCAFMTLPAAWGLQPPLTGWLADPSVLGPGSAGVQLGSPVGYKPSLALQGGTPGFMLPLLMFNQLMAVWGRRGAAAGGEQQEAGGGEHREQAGGSSGGEVEDEALAALAADAGQEKLAAAGWGEEAGPQGCAQPGPAFDVAAVHAHVVRLQQLFLQGLADQEERCRGAGSGSDGDGGSCGGISLLRLVTRQAPGVRSHTLVFRQDSPHVASQVVEGLLARGVLVDTRRGYVRLGFGFNHSEEDVARLLAALR